MANPRKQTYKVGVSWNVSGELEVQAWDEDDALRKADEKISKGEFPKPTHEVDHDSVDIYDSWLATQDRSVAEIPTIVSHSETNKKANDIFELIFPNEAEKTKEIVLEPKDRARI